MLVKERNRVRIAYLDQGRGDPALVFIHGWSCNSSYFRHQLEHFKAAHRVISVDLRGHGESDRPEAAYPVSLLAEDVAWLIGELGLDRPVVVGHSLGGLVALEIAAEHPDSARAIVMIDPAPLAKPEVVRAALQGLITALEAGDRGPVREFVARMFPPSSDPALRDRIVEEMCSAPPQVAANVMRGTLHYDGVAAAGRVRLPALHLAGTPPRNAPQLMSEWLPSVVTGWPVGSGHFSMLEVPLQVNDMITKFLDQHVARASTATAAATR